MDFRFTLLLLAVVGCWIVEAQDAEAQAQLQVS
jgi:hypothetical protein